jgi:hypothetical protein
MPVILATLKAEIERIAVRGQPKQKDCKTLSHPIKSWTWWHKPVIPVM